MLVSAVIPCYNAQSTIRIAIDSLLQQTVSIDEIIVVNDGSTDDSLAVIKELEKVHDSILIIDQKNEGVCVARNNGILKAAGDYILTLDADDYFNDTFVEKALEKFAENDQYGAIMCGYVRVVKGKKIMPYIPQEISLQSCLMNNGALSCLLFKKSAILEAGLYDVAMKDNYEDWDLNIRILKLGYRYGVVREVLFNYVDSENSRNDVATEKDVVLRKQIFNKYRDDYNTHLEYFFTEFIRENNRLKKENQRIKNSRSFLWSHAIITYTERFKKKFKAN